MSEIVTIFRNIRETETPFHRSVAFVLNRIKDGASKDIVSRIRKEKDKASRNEIKKELPAVCFSGQFNKRSDAAIQEHSGFICLDFDGYNTKKEMMTSSTTQHNGSILTVMDMVTIRTETTQTPS